MKVLVAQEDQHLMFRIIEYGLNPDTEYFSINDLKKELKLHPHEVNQCRTLRSDNLQLANPNHIMVIVEIVNAEGKTLNPDEYICTLLPSAVSHYLEYEEMKLARENSEVAKEQSRIANKQSLIAIAIALFFGVVQTVISLISLYK